MRLAAIYIVWYDGIEILPFSIASIEDSVDEILLIYSNASNHGHTIYYVDQLAGLGTVINWEPDPSKQPAENEVAKRNFGLEAARGLGFTHFIMMDCDECYLRAEFDIERDKIIRTDATGAVCPLKVYIREPTLMCCDHTLVPFIHKLDKGMRYELNNKAYPHTYDEGGAHIDPTRRLNVTKGIERADLFMHHFSQVRKDITLKMNNSTARSNLTRSTLLEDYHNAKPGYYSKFYRDTLQETPNRFGIKF